jgi:hypothetical protein
MIDFGLQWEWPWKRHAKEDEDRIDSLRCEVSDLKRVAAALLIANKKKIDLGDNPDRGRVSEILGLGPFYYGTCSDMPLAYSLRLDEDLNEKVGACFDKWSTKRKSWFKLDEQEESVDDHN